MTHGGPVLCQCVVTHVPKPFDIEIHHIVPLYMGGPDTTENRINLCANAHNNVHALLRFYDKAQGKPAWEILSQFSPYVRELAARGWLGRP